MTGNEKFSSDESDWSDPPIPDTDTDSDPEIPDDEEPSHSHISSYNKVCFEPCKIII